MTVDLTVSPVSIVFRVLPYLSRLQQLTNTDNTGIHVVLHYIPQAVTELALNLEGCEATFQVESSPPRGG